MSTAETRKSEIKGFLRNQEKLGGVNLAEVPTGTTVLVETRQYVYQIKIMETPMGRRYVIDTAAPNCEKNFICHTVSSHCSKLKYEMKNWIGLNLRLLLQFNSGTSVLGGEVTGATVIGVRKDGSKYKYDVWG